MNPHVQLNPPFCAKCKKSVDQASVGINPHTQFAKLQYICHGVRAEMNFAQYEMMEFKPTTTLIDFVEFKRVD